MAEEDRLVRFHLGQETDHRGRYLFDIQRWPDNKLETVHDYIQWLFPLPERSGFNLAAPVLTAESIQEFRTRTELQQNLRVSFLRMMSFYGLEARLAEAITVTRSSSFAVRSAGWLSASNHHHLRITRILRCLSVLGLEAEAKAFFECLAEIHEEERSKPAPAISDETFEYWRAAATEL